MKTNLKSMFSILIMFLLISFAGHGRCYAQMSIDSVISNDSMNLAILEMDFLSNQFIRASVLHYPLCNCDQDSLPFLGVYNSPADFGDMKFYYTFNNQLLFEGTLVWMGQGQINYPTSFTPASAFPVVAESIPLPSNAQYLYWSVFPASGGYTYFKLKSDTMWKAISNLQLVHEFATEHQMRVGFFGYAPSQGMFNPEPARWIIFLYRGNTVTSNLTTMPGNIPEISIYPNPATEALIIHSKNPSNEKLRLKIFDMTGRLILEERIDKEIYQRIDIKNFKRGIYHYMIDDGQKNINATFVKS